MDNQPSGFDNRISLQKLEVLCLVVELGGIGRAAQHLGVSQPVVTAHMRTLQERIGTQLLVRDAQGMHLTETGEAVHEWAKEVLSRSREVARQVQGLTDGATGTAVVTSSMSIGSYMLPGIVSDFLRERPRASITLLVSDSEDARTATEQGDADFAVVTEGTDVRSGNLTAEPLCDHEIVLVAAPGDPHVGDVVDVDELARLRFVCSPAARPRRRLMDAALEEIGVPERRVVLQVGHPEALKRATASGIGVSLMLRCSAQAEIDSGDLRELAIEGARLTVPIVLIRRVDKRFSPLQGVLLATIREGLIERFAAAPQSLAR
jgi:DNA-binding transcriptional LysR family regulator